MHWYTNDNKWRKIMRTKLFYRITMLRFGKTKVAINEFYGAKKAIKLWDVNVDNIVISKLVKTKGNCKYLIEYFDDAIRPLVLILPKTNGYVRKFKDNDQDKNMNYKLMSSSIDNDKLLEKYKIILTRIKDLQNSD